MIMLFKKFAFFGVLAVYAGVGVSSALANALEKCTQGQQQIFDFRGGEIKRKDEETLCRSRGGSVGEYVTVRFCVTKAKSESCASRFGEDYTYSYKSDCCAYDAPVDPWAVWQ